MNDALAALRPGSDIDLRGTPLTQDLLNRVLRALTPDGDDAAPCIGTAQFDKAQFSGEARFDKVQFNQDAWFFEAQFSGLAGFGEAQFNCGAGFDKVQFSAHAGFGGAQFSLTVSFGEARFSKDAWFGEAQFNWDTWFDKAQFSKDVWFDKAQFNWDARFDEAQFSGDASFVGAQFSREARFDEAQFSGDASFVGAQFSREARFIRAQFRGEARFIRAQFSREAGFDKARFEGAWIGPLLCRGTSLTARQVTVAHTVRLQVAASRVVLEGARFAEPSVFSVRYAKVDLRDVVADAPVTVAWHAAPFTLDDGAPMAEEGLSGSPRAGLVSLAGADAANIVLSDVDLSWCVFSGAHHLDQIRLEGRCLFATAPRGRHWGRAIVPVRRWTRRKVLAEEAAWRADPERRPALARVGWNPAVGTGSPPVPLAAPAQLAVLYRQLRKALEDGKDTPGAADFYYGEMEARRHDTQATPRGERALLHAYWLLSGYALRASRALGFLAATAGVTFLLMMTVGLPDNQLNPQITGTVSAPGGQAVLTESTPDPALTLPWGQRFTTARADQAGLVVVNSVIFRSTDTTLTGPGTWIEIISRIGEPVLLGFAAVAARGRVQR